VSCARRRIETHAIPRPGDFLVFDSTRHLESLRWANRAGVSRSQRRLFEPRFPIRPRPIAERYDQVSATCLTNLCDDSAVQNSRLRLGRFPRCIRGNLTCRWTDRITEKRGRGMYEMHARNWGYRDLVGMSTRAEVAILGQCGAGDADVGDLGVSTKPGADSRDGSPQKLIRRLDGCRCGIFGEKKIYGRLPTRLPRKQGTYIE